MSGICAVVRLDGRPADGGEIAPVLAALAARGPDRSGAACDGPAALGHALNATTPESLAEPMPLRHPETGCIITADVRLDNREELVARLGLDPAGRVIGDGEIILAAYLKWGPDCARQLVGDFAFAVWDPRCQRLFAARDKVGMRQLITHFAPGKVFACATDARALLEHRDVPLRIDEGRIADLIQAMEAIDETSTFFLDLKKLPPAHALVIEGGALRTWRYWRLEPAEVIHRASDAEYEAAFLEVFTEAVRVRLRSSGTLGSMLSGGMDSGSVVAVAARLLHDAGAPPLRTFSAVHTDPDCAETQAIRTAMAMPHLDPRTISSGDLGALREEVAAMIRGCAEPFDGHMAMVMAVYAKARADGVRTMLDGVSGDTTLGPGNVVLWHLDAGRLWRAWQEARGNERYWGRYQPAARDFTRLLYRRYVPAPVQQAWRGMKRRAGITPPGEIFLLDREFAERIDYPARQARFRERVAMPDNALPETRVRRMLHPFAIAARERYDRVAGAFGIEPRDPFLDTRLLEFCRTLPVDQVQSGGWPKLILRRSMTGLMPDSLRWRTGRTHVGSWFVEAFQSQSPAVLAAQLGAGLRHFVDPAAVARLASTSSNDSALASLTELRYLADWNSGIATTRKIGDFT